ncbi:SDR family oxidoreductase [Microbacter margulisiae]|uniref:Putative oxidoreductase n=1 Tax=Microbacter margulisiae TaxID=1350067 RepID=A0A7W5DQF9_9PORP|nr:SDR family NAD(P)-dependent oxidoreductase [Microbacter margulisiae]MBB3187169.1 putative oxidoreductase [Microbacter margulisiae]
MKLSDNKILITGGATGIGLGLTERFLQEGNTVIICGRREEVLQEVVDKHPSVIAKVCDLSLPFERERLFQWIAAAHPDVNVLVNNAGIQQRMSLFDHDFAARAHEEIAINVEAPVHLISLFLKLKSLNTIVNVTSALGLVPMSQVADYSATKAFSHSFTASMRAILASSHVEVIEIIPPALNTDLGGKGLHDYAPSVSDFIAHIFEQLTKGETTLTFGYSESLSKIGLEEWQQVFDRMNTPR